MPKKRNLFIGQKNNQADKHKSKEDGKENLPKTIRSRTRDLAVFPVDEKVVLFAAVSIGTYINGQENMFKRFLGQLHVHGQYSLGITPNILFAPSGGNVSGDFLGVQVPFF